MRDFRNNQLKLEHSVVTIGAFEGIHRGHQALIKKTSGSIRGLLHVRARF
jgi:FAD synthase